MAHLQFLAISNQTSAFVPLRVSDANAYQANGALVPRILAHDGRITVIGAAPLLEALLSTNETRTIVLYGTPGKSYAVESSTNLVNPAWTLFGQGILTNQSRRFDAGRTNRTWFYRAREQ